MNDNEQKIVNNIKESGILCWIKSQISKIKGRTLIDLIIIAIPVLLIYVYFNLDPTEIKQTLKDNKKIEGKIDSLKSDNQFIVERMYELEKKQTLFFEALNQNNDLIKENNKELIKLKRIYNEKINSINGYNVSQLDSFFTNRYKEYYNK